MQASTGLESTHLLYVLLALLGQVVALLYAAICDQQPLEPAQICIGMPRVTVKQVPACEGTMNGREQEMGTAHNERTWEK